MSEQLSDADQLVERLRWKWADHGVGHNSDYTADLIAAADLIVHLQDRLAELERIARAARLVCAYDWSDNDEDAVAAMDRLHDAVAPWLERHRAASTTPSTPPAGKLRMKKYTLMEQGDTALTEAKEGEYYLVSDVDARIDDLMSVLTDALPVIEAHTPRLSTSGTMVSLRDRLRTALKATPFKPPVVTPPGEISSVGVAANDCIPGYWSCQKCKVCISKMLYHTSCPCCGTLRTTETTEGAPK